MSAIAGAAVVHEHVDRVRRELWRAYQAGKLSEDEFAELKHDGYEKDDKVGKAGVELTYEDDLRGTNGLQHVEVDAGGQPSYTIHPGACSRPSPTSRYAAV